jgi:hypothetical protein
LELSAFFDAGLFAIIGYFVYRNSRVAAVLGLIEYAAWLLLAPPNSIRGPTCLVVAIVLIAFANGIRGTFAIHRFRRRTE